MLVFGLKLCLSRRIIRLRLLGLLGLGTVGSEMVQGVGFEPTAPWRFLPQIPLFSVFGFLFGLFCCFGLYFSLEVVEWTFV